jgi:hypothetical protein
MFKQHVKKPLAIRSLMLLFLAAALFAFSEVGGDSYTIYVGDKLMMKEHVMANRPVPTISINAENAGDLLRVYYSHCGKTGVERSVSVNDRDKKVLKTWRFSDNVEMEVHLKDVVSAAGNSNTVQLVYTSREIADGKVLAGISLPGSVKASLK